MGLLDRLQNGIAAGAQTASDAFMAQFKSQVEQDRQEALVRTQEGSQKRMADYKVQLDDQQREKKGGLLSAASQGLNDEREVLKARINAADNAGYTDEADKMRNRLNSMDNIDRQDRMNEWQMKHGDEQLKAQEKHYRAIENQAASALNLKKQERQDLNDAMSAYTVADANVKMLDKTADEKTIKAAVMARDAAALRLQPYGIKIGSDGQGSFHANVIDDKSTGENILAVTNQKTGDVTVRTASELRSGSKGGNPLDKWAPPAAASQQNGSPANSSQSQSRSAQPSAILSPAERRAAASTEVTADDIERNRQALAERRRLADEAESRRLEERRKRNEQRDKEREAMNRLSRNRD